MVQEGVPSEGCSASLSGSKLWVVKTSLVLETLTIQDIVFEKRFTIRPTNCHMRLGSISVAPGQLIEAGGELGRVGLSGNTQFPHVYLQVLHNGAVIDPFAPDGTGACGDTVKTLWKSKPAYQPGGILAAGFATSLLSFENIRCGPQETDSLPLDAPALTFWGYFFGLQKNDEVKITITQPDGATLVQQDFTIERSRAVAYRLTGKRRKLAQWPTGPYAGEVTLLRAGVVFDRKQVLPDVR